jgi:hypothetical protein
MKRGWITTEQVDVKDRESTIVLEMSEISDNSLFQSCNQVVTDNDSALEYTTSRISTFATENPLQSYMKSKSLKVNSMPTQAPHVSTSLVVRTSDDSRTANQLYRSYLKEVSLVERSSLSFEDWKLNRKKFKENTRHSFIAAYNNIADLIEGRTNERLRDLHFNRYRDNQHSNVEGENIQDGSSESNVKTMIRRFSALPPPPPPPPPLLLLLPPMLHSGPPMENPPSSWWGPAVKVSRGGGEAQWATSALLPHVFMWTRLRPVLS